MEDSYGKYPTALGNVVIIETDLFEHLARYAATDVLARLKKAIETVLFLVSSSCYSLGSFPC